MRRFKKLQAIFFIVLNALISVIKLSRIPTRYPKISQHKLHSFTDLYRPFYTFTYLFTPFYTFLYFLFRFILLYTFCQYAQKQPADIHRQASYFHILNPTTVILQPKFFLHLLQLVIPISASAVFILIKQ